jgi:esterase FrsA
VAPGVALYHTGPALDHGPLPSIFYFALSGTDSLTQDPINQPIQFLSDQWIRCFSMTLPAHESGLSPKDAMATWAEDMLKGVDVVGEFIEQALMAIEFAIRQKFADKEKMGLMGLSRGAFIASHLAAQEERFRSIVQFAPLTNLAKIKEFQGIQKIQEHPIIQGLDLFALAPKLSNQHIRFYIGNKDQRTDTRSCIEFALHLAEQSSLRSPQIEPKFFAQAPNGSLKA